MRKKVLGIIVIVVLFLGLLPSTVLAADDSSNDNLIETSATGQIEVAPDLAYIYLNVRTEKSSSNEAQQQNAYAVNSTMDTLQANGVKPEDITTFGYSTYSYTKADQSDKNNTNDVIVFTTSSNLKVTIRSLTTVGDILSALSSIKELNVTSVNYTVSDTSKYKQQVINQAIQEAKENIEFSAEALGLQLDRMHDLQVNYNNSSTGRIYPMQPAANSAAGQVNIPQPQNPDTITISASVALSYYCK